MTTLRLNTLELQAGDLVEVDGGTWVKLTGEPTIWNGMYGTVHTWQDCPIVEGSHPLGWKILMWDVQGNANAMWTVRR